MTPSNKTRRKIVAECEESEDEQRSKMPSNSMVKRSHFKQINQNFTQYKSFPNTHALTARTRTHSFAFLRNSQRRRKKLCTHLTKMLYPKWTTQLESNGRRVVEHEKQAEYITIATTNKTTKMKSFMNMLKLSHFNRFKSNFSSPNPLNTQ